MANKEDRLLHDITFGSAHQVIKYGRHLLDNNISVTVDPAVDMSIPSLLCANHFTRIETFLLPSFLFQKFGVRVRSLADKGLFKTALGKGLESAGTLSTDDPNRDTIILSDLIKGKKSWNIYPEGRMMKNKWVTEKGGLFILHEPEKEHAVYTGSAVLAIKCELAKRAFRRAQKRCDIVDVEHIRKAYNIDPDEDIAYQSIQIIPITITYFPIRPGHNKVMDMANSIIKERSKAFDEELEIEGNLLLHANMHIHLGEPIDVSKVIKSHIRALELKGVVDPDDNSIIDACRNDLTTQMMERVYRNVFITFDHVFALVLEYFHEPTLRLTQLRSIIFLSVKEIIDQRIYNVHPTLKRDFYQLLADEGYFLFDDVLALAIKQGVMSVEEDGSYRIHKEVLRNQHNFTTVRIVNTLRVILNEICMHTDLHDVIREQIHKRFEYLQKEVFNTIFEQDKRRFDYAYKRCYSLVESKPKEVGAPFVLYDPSYEKGMVISHGYKSAPKEVEYLAEYVHNKGYNVYAIRIEGHGTHPEDLKVTSYVQWIDSFNRGFAAMRQISKRLFLCGFSTGGLLALNAAASKQHKVDGLILINTAIEINDARFNYILPTIGKINDWLAVINANIEYIDSPPENPEINYNKHHVRSISQLKELISHVQKRLKDVECETLIIQGDNDPVVNANSATVIFEKIQSERKEIELIKADHHVIIHSQTRHEVFKVMDGFLERH